MREGEGEGEGEGDRGREGGGRERVREGDDVLLSVPKRPTTYTLYPYTPAANLVTVVTDRRAALRGKRGA